MAKKITKQEVKQQTSVVQKILALKGLSYEEWLYEIQQEFINDNVSFLIELMDKRSEVKEVKQEQNIEYKGDR